MQYKNYLLGMMMLFGIVSVFDRFVFAFMLEPIKQDLGLSDGQLGLMSGIAFAAFYAIAGIPIARWADRGDRITLATTVVGLLGVFLVLCGMVTNFFQLLLARAGVAIGEAGCMPVAQSLLADYFDRSERPKTMATFMAFYPISMIVGYLAGGWLVEELGWRTTFVFLAVPGLLVAVLIKMTLKEPRLSYERKRRIDQPPLNEVLKVLWKKKSFRQLLIAFCVSFFFFMGSAQWLAPFFIRSHGIDAAELGVWLALGWGVSGVLGNYAGGYLATRYAPSNERLQLRALAAIVVLSGVANAGLYLSPNMYVALSFGALFTFLSSLGNGTVFSAIQSLVSENMRSVSLSLVYLFAYIIGFGLGPLAIGIVSDLLTPMFGQEALRYALALSTPGVLWVAVHYWKAADGIDDDMNSPVCLSPEYQPTHCSHP